MVEMLIYILIFLFVALIVVIGMRPMRIGLFADGIVIKGLYGVTIPNNTILSMRLVDEMPKIRMRTNGFNGIRSLKGFCILNTERGGRFGERALLFLRNKKAPFIEIDTVGGLVYINQNNEDQTSLLFDEMKQTVKLVGKDEVDYSAKKGFRRSSAKSVILVLLTLLGLFGLIIWQVSKSDNTRVEVTPEGVETFGTYAEKIPAADFVSACLIDTMPKIAECRSGISIKGKRVGYFKLADKTRCSLFLEDVYQPPYIELKTKSELFFFNKFDAEETRTLYKQIVNLINRK